MLIILWMILTSAFVFSSIYDKHYIIISFVKFIGMCTLLAGMIIGINYGFRQAYDGSYILRSTQSIVTTLQTDEESVVYVDENGQIQTILVSDNTEFTIVEDGLSCVEEYEPKQMFLNQLLTLIPYSTRKQYVVHI